MQRKINFVNMLSEAISQYQSNVWSVQYRVFKHTSSGAIYEFLVVTYVGGAISVRNCNGNSYSAIFKELSELLDSGYYDEVRGFMQIESSDEYEEIK